MAIFVVAFSLSCYLVAPLYYFNYFIRLYLLLFRRLNLWERLLLFGDLLFRRFDRHVFSYLVFFHVVLARVTFTATASTTFTLFSSFGQFDELFIFTKFLVNTLIVELEIGLIDCNRACFLFFISFFFLICLFWFQLK